MVYSDFVSAIASFDELLSKIDPSESLEVARLYVDVFSYREYLYETINNYFDKKSAHEC